MKDDIRSHFPILSRTIGGKPLIYLDSAATMQVPREVMAAVSDRVGSINANVHRGIYALSEESTADYEAARAAVADYLGAEPDEIVFTQGTTHGINLAAASIGQRLTAQDCILTTVMEHHSNLIPWQQICAQKGAALLAAPLDHNGDLDMDALEVLLRRRPRLLAVTACSNVTGAVPDIPRICAMAHAFGVPVLVDGAQHIAHSHPDVRRLGCDYYCFSAHKIMGLTGTGVLYARRDRMQELAPFQFGGGMVRQCTPEGCEFERAPYCLEAGTPNFVGATALRAALELRRSWDEAALFHHADTLLRRAEDGLNALPGVRVLGQPDCRKGCLSFTAEGAHPFDIAALLDKKGIAVRSGHHCAMPLLRVFGCEHAVRISPAFYNTEREIDAFLDCLRQVLRILQ